VNLSINVSQLLTGAISSVTNAGAILISSRYLSKAIEKVEKKTVNGNGKVEDKK